VGRIKELEMTLSAFDRGVEPIPKKPLPSLRRIRKRNKVLLSRKFLAKLLKIFFRDTSQRAVCCSVKRATSPLFDIPELFHLLFDTPLAARTFKA
jgi:hypothetical protein